MYLKQKTIKSLKKNNFQAMGNSMSNEVHVFKDSTFYNDEIIIIEGENKTKVQDMALEICKLNKIVYFKQSDLMYNANKHKWCQEFYFHKKRQHIL